MRMNGDFSKSSEEFLDCFSEEFMENSTTFPNREAHKVSDATSSSAERGRINNVILDSFPTEDDIFLLESPEFPSNGLGIGSGEFDAKIRQDSREFCNDSHSNDMSLRMDGLEETEATENEYEISSSLASNYGMGSKVELNTQNNGDEESRKLNPSSGTGKNMSCSPHLMPRQLATYMKNMNGPSSSRQYLHQPSTKRKRGADSQPIIKIEPDGEIEVDNTSSTRHGQTGDSSNGKCQTLVEMHGSAEACLGMRQDTKRMSHSYSMMQTNANVKMEGAVQGSDPPNENPWRNREQMSRKAAACFRGGKGNDCRDQDGGDEIEQGNSRRAQEEGDAYRKRMERNRREQIRSREISYYIKMIKKQIDLTDSQVGSKTSRPKANKFSVLEDAANMILSLQSQNSQSQGPLRTDRKQAPVTAKTNNSNNHYGGLQIPESIDYRSIFYGQAIGSAFTSLDGKILDCNDRFAAASGYSKQELEGMTFFSLVHGDDLAPLIQTVSWMISDPKNRHRTCAMVYRAAIRPDPSAAPQTTKPEQQRLLRISVLFDPQSPSTPSRFLLMYSPVDFGVSTVG